MQPTKGDSLSSLWGESLGPTSEKGPAVVVRSAEKHAEKAQVAAFTLAAALSQAGAADAAVTPSLKNLLLSLVAGGTVLAVIAVAIIGVSSFDKVVRK